MTKNNKDTKLYVISYFTLRKSVGVLGIAFPIVLVIGYAIFNGEFKILNSISSYYHSKMGNGFVGILCAVALFLFSYRGHSIKDNIAGNLGCIFALGIAFLPNSPWDPSALINVLHLVSAGLFFTVLIYFSLVLFTKSDQTKPFPKPKRNRNTVYYICGFTMLGSILTIAVYIIFFRGNYEWLDKLNLIFWLETLALFAFGISWLTKGQAIIKDK